MKNENAGVRELIAAVRRRAADPATRTDQTTAPPTRIAPVAIGLEIALVEARLGLRIPQVSAVCLLQRRQCGAWAAGINVWNQMFPDTGDASG